MRTAREQNRRNNVFRFTVVVTFIGVVSIICSNGCESRFNFGDVEGTVLLDGKPLDNVRVIFIPDPEKKTRGKRSVAITDRNGHFFLEYEGKLGKGAVTGWHRVVIEDRKLGQQLLASREPSLSFLRLPAKYSSLKESPLRFEVRQGSQKFIIKLTGQ